MRSRWPRRLLAPLLGLSVLGATFLIPAATFAATPACAAGPWPASVQGAPATYKSGGRAGDYIWHTSTGWHLRVTHVTTSKLAFAGKIVANAPMSVAPVRLEKGDVFALSADKKTLTYHFANYGNVDGLDIKTACATTALDQGHDVRRPRCRSGGSGSVAPATTRSRTRSSSPAEPPPGTAPRPGSPRRPGSFRIRPATMAPSTSR